MPTLEYDLVMLDTTKVKKLRIAADLTQEDAARRAGLTGRSQWNDIESGRRSNITLETLGGIASALKVEPADLLLKKKRGAK